MKQRKFFSYDKARWFICGAIMLNAIVFLMGVFLAISESLWLEAAFSLGFVIGLFEMVFVFLGGWE